METGERKDGDRMRSISPGEVVLPAVNRRPTVVDALAYRCDQPKYSGSYQELRGLENYSIDGKLLYSQCMLVHRLCVGILSISATILQILSTPSRSLSGITVGICHADITYNRFENGPSMSLPPC